MNSDRSMIEALQYVLSLSTLDPKATISMHRRTLAVIGGVAKQALTDLPAPHRMSGAPPKWMTDLAVRIAQQPKEWRA